MVPKQLGELLIESGIITPDQLKEALAIQKEKSGLIGQILIGLGYATEQAIAQALTVQYGFPYLPLADYEIERDIARTVPEAVARQYSLVAVDRLGKMLTVAMANPLNAEAIDEVERITHLNVQVFVTTQSDVNDAIKRCYKD
jgi:type IV pilus assembly protein PilB